MSPKPGNCFYLILQHTFFGIRSLIFVFQQKIQQTMHCNGWKRGIALHWGESYLVLFQTWYNQTNGETVVKDVEVSFSLANFEDETYLGDKEKESKRDRHQDWDFIQDVHQIVRWSRLLSSHWLPSIPAQSESNPSRILIWSAIKIVIYASMWMYLPICSASTIPFQENWCNIYQAHLKVLQQIYTFFPWNVIFLLSKWILLKCVCVCVCVHVCVFWKCVFQKCIFWKWLLQKWRFPNWLFLN